LIGFERSHGSDFSTVVDVDAGAVVVRVVGGGLEMRVSEEPHAPATRATDSAAIVIRPSRTTPSG
jgi:hypothetical protein